MFFKPFIEKITVSKEGGNDESSATVKTINSRPILPEQANPWKENYRQKPLAGLKTANDELITGFSFDVNDIRKMTYNMNKDDIIHISFALTDLQNGSYTLILAPAEYKGNDEHELIHNTDSSIWLEYSRPCPPKCPTGSGK